MPGVCRDGDATTTGHGCDTTTKVTIASGNVYCNTKLVERKTDPTVSHDRPVGDPVVCTAHTSSISAGSGTVKVNSLPIARIDDACDSGAITGGSGNVIAGG